MCGPRVYSQIGELSTATVHKTLGFYYQESQMQFQEYLEK